MEYRDSFESLRKNIFHNFVDNKEELVLKRTLND
jgi:hypothetical protein